MATRIPQNRAAREAANAALRTYGTQKAAAKALNISPKTLRKIQHGTGRVRDSTAARMSTAMATDDLSTIGVDELLGMQEYYSASDTLTPRQRQAARAVERALDKAEREGKGPGDVVERPTLKKGIAEWRLGRGKEVAWRKQWEKKMRAKGYTGDLQGMYDEATGYTRM